METISVTAVTSIAPGPDYMELKRTVHNLSQQVADLIAEQKRINASIRQNIRYRRSRSNSRRPNSLTGNRRRSLSRQDTTGTLCWYHQRFGEQAQKCTEPCTFQKQEN
jgi:hypothetical protein